MNPAAILFDFQTNAYGEELFTLYLKVEVSESGKRMHITTSMGPGCEACDEGGALPSHPGPVQGEEHLAVGAG